MSKSNTFSSADPEITTASNSSAESSTAPSASASGPPSRRVSLADKKFEMAERLAYFKQPRDYVDALDQEYLKVKITQFNKDDKQNTVGSPKLAVQTIVLSIEFYGTKLLNNIPFVPNNHLVSGKYKFYRDAGAELRFWRKELKDTYGIIEKTAPAFQNYSIELAIECWKLLDELSHDSKPSIPIGPQSAAAGRVGFYPAPPVNPANIGLIIKEEIAYWETQQPKTSFSIRFQTSLNEEFKASISPSKCHCCLIL